MKKLATLITQMSISIAVLAAGRNLQAQNSHIDSYSSDGTLVWTTEDTNIFCGLDYATDLMGSWSHAVGFYWDLFITNQTNVAHIGMPEGVNSLFLRIVCSSNSLLGEPYNVDSNGIPLFVASDYIELESMGRISRFRSGAGHDYSDDFESCRSMKHYFEPNVANWSDVPVFSPVEGTVYNLTEEWAGTQTWIQSSNYPAFFFILFHVDLTNSLVLGDSVAAGEQIGTHIGDQTTSDIAVGVNTPTGWKLISFFDVMTEALFADYTNRGVMARSDLIISEAERDADPLVCDGETFADPGSLTNWVDLD